MENGTFAPPQEQMFHFSKYLKNLTFQRRPKALVWSIGSKILGQLSSGARGIEFGLSLHLHAFFVFVSSEGSGKTAQICRLI